MVELNHKVKMSKDDEVRGASICMSVYQQVQILKRTFFPTHQNGFELYNILHSLCIDGF